MAVISVVDIQWLASVFGLMVALGMLHEIVFVVFFYLLCFLVPIQSLRVSVLITIENFKKAT